MQQEKFEDLLREEGFFTKKPAKERTIVELPVVSIGHKFVGVDLNLKSEGYIPLEQFKKSKHDTANVSVGSLIPVFIETYDNGHGQPVLSYERAIQEISKQDVMDSLKQKNKFITVIGSHLTSAGIVALYNTLEVFLPYTLCSMDGAINKEIAEELFIGKPFKVSVIKTDFEKNHILVSHRAFLESESGLSFEKLVEKIQVGNIYEAQVRTIQKYGAFISLNGIDTLLKINDIGWTNLENTSDVLKYGQKIKVMVTKIEEEKSRIYVSHKLANTQPWVDFVKNHHEGEIIKVSVLAIKEDFVIVRYNNSIDFIIHQDEVNESNIRGKLYHFFEIGQEINAKIKSIDSSEHRVVLTVKQGAASKLDSLVDQVIKAKVIAVTDYGLKVLHNDSGEVIFVSKHHLKAGYNQEEVLKGFKEGDIVDVKIVKYKENCTGTLILGETLYDKASKYKKGEVVKGLIVKKVNKSNIEVETEDGLRGLVTISSNLTINLADLYQDNQIIDEAKYKSFDKNSYMHFELDINFNNNYDNPKLSDVINKK